MLVMCTDFVLDAACQAAEQPLLDQRLFMASGPQYQALLDLLEQPARDNISDVELKALRRLADELLSYGDTRIEKALGGKELVEVVTDDE